MKLILASNSPRRKQILLDNGFLFEVISSDFAEKSQNLPPEEIVKINALGKAESVFNNLKDKDSVVVLGADTIVCFNNQILGKPNSKQHAIDMLKNLSNKSHKVLTGYALITNKEKIVKVETSVVTFNNLSDSVIKNYVETGKPLDKAGAYGIQDGFPIVKEYKGSYNNIVGLPIESFIDKLNKLLNSAL